MTASASASPLLSLSHSDGVTDRQSCGVTHFSDLREREKDKVDHRWRRVVAGHMSEGEWKRQFEKLILHVEEGGARGNAKEEGL